VRAEKKQQAKKIESGQSGVETIEFCKFGPKLRGLGTNANANVSNTVFRVDSGF